MRHFSKTTITAMGYTAKISDDMFILLDGSNPVIQRSVAEMEVESPGVLAAFGPKSKLARDISRMTSILECLDAHEEFGQILDEIENPSLKVEAKVEAGKHEKPNSMLAQVTEASVEVEPKAEVEAQKTIGQSVAENIVRSSEARLSTLMDMGNVPQPLIDGIKAKIADPLKDIGGVAKFGDLPFSDVTVTKGRGGKQIVFFATELGKVCYCKGKWGKMNLFLSK